MWAAAVVAGSAILFGVPSPIHVDAPAARAAIETLIATAALVSAGVLLLSFRYGRRRSDLLLFTALTAVGLTDLVFSALPALTGSEILAFGSGPQVACDALAAVAFAAAAFTADGRLPGRLRPLCLAGGVTMGMVALASVVDVAAGRSALSAISAQSGIGAAAQHPVLLVEAIFSSAVLLVAGAAFLSRSERNARLLACASYLLAAARLQYLALPAMAPDWVTAHDGLRLAAYALLVMAALTRYEETRREQTAATLAAERDRIARDLHDGLAQDLAYIALQGQRLSTELGTEHPLTLAARRAVAASREVIVDLAASTASSTDAAIRDVADELAARFGIDVDISVLDAAQELASNELDPVRRGHVVRIVREAVVNAARHGAARHVAVVLDRSGDQLQLRVSDDGQGVEQTGLRARNGHGLHMMRARAVALGGEMIARRRIGGGVDIEVTFPRTRHAGESR
ncbi:MAG: sensor histidine kinase [Solirubrobacteraceae bacterium]